MEHLVALPTFGRNEALDTIQLLKIKKWRARNNQQVRSEQPICIVSIKNDDGKPSEFELEASCSGTITLIGKEGGEYPLGEVIATITTAS